MPQKVALSLALLGIVLLAGCTVSLSRPLAPERAGYPWTTTSRLWVVRTTDNTTCHPDEDVTIHGCHTYEFLALWYDGSLLDVRARATRSNWTMYWTPCLMTKNSVCNDQGWGNHTQAFATVVGAINAQPGLAISGLTAMQLNIHDVDPDLQVVQLALQQTTPVPSNATAAAGNITTYHLFGPPKTLVANWTGAPPTAAWQNLDRQMDLFQRWLDHPPPATHPIM